MSNTLLSKILAPNALSTVLQPIYEEGSAGFTPVILECLTRGPAGTNAAHAGVLFDYAQLKAAEPRVDRACIEAALRTIAVLPATMRISLNVFAATLVRDGGFVLWIDAEARKLKLDPSHLIFEIVESGEAWDVSAFKNSIREIRSLGCAIALDDVGLAHSNFQRILECDPDFLKLDQCIVRRCHEDHRRRALLKSLVSLGRDLGVCLIAEGVETEEELRTLRGHGLTFFQGYLFCPPSPPSEIQERLASPVLTHLTPTFSCFDSHAEIQQSSSRVIDYLPSENRVAPGLEQRNPLSK